MAEPNVYLIRVPTEPFPIPDCRESSERQVVFDVHQSPAVNQRIPGLGAVEHGWEM
jgi:hypothetical protein